MPAVEARTKLNDMSALDMENSCDLETTMHSLRADFHVPNCSLEHESIEKKSGRLYMHLKLNDRERKLRVYVKVYSSNFDHYAIVNQDKRFGGQTSYINLKNYNVERLDNKDNTFQLVSTRPDGATVVLSCTNSCDLDSWVQTLKSDDFMRTRAGSRSPVIPRSPVMPTLEEDTEEDNDIGT
ncbi:unnamed protein product [Owenia fusiformis]|uniref:PH domain-containing protein n=1 Tax=Owenia fusiformis TaxID=6347 RepID=A0A8S4N9C5_OWEFU|nr:unnamed protein product [Owenia fusiformis]